ncbi:MAG: lysine transporter LysE [Phototrophicales bacterium]|jgi:cysteine/O-acetylserine efflux protein|nr:MAG: lysine transporter LysE [Phototrophicales bacterium]
MILSDKPAYAGFFYMDTYMDNINFGAFIIFVIVTTFTPGPNNISSSSLGVIYGYRKTVPYMLGIALGFFMTMFVTGVISHTLYHIIPSVEGVMRIIGAGYILWLAYKTLKLSYDFADDTTLKIGLRDGLLLQLFNVKVWLYGLALYTTFLAGITGNIVLLTISAIFLAGVAFTSTSSWALFGSATKQMLRHPRLQQGVNVILALLLVYNAIDLSGILSFTAN